MRVVDSWDGHRLGQPCFGRLAATEAFRSGPMALQLAQERDLTQAFTMPIRHSFLMNRTTMCSQWQHHRFTQMALDMMNYLLCNYHGGIDRSLP